jgi:fused signal recognition particle receptor
MPVEKPKPAVEPKLARPQPKALKAGLEKTRQGFFAKLGGIFQGKKEIDENLMAELEEVLFTADIGVRTSQKLFDRVKDALSKKQLKDVDAVYAALKTEAMEILNLNTKPMAMAEHQPFVLLTVGVNGVGKTTTIGKLAAQFTEEGRRCILAAGDTFRAAAVEQLEVWAARVDAPIVKGKDGQDPSSVIFEAIKRAKEEGFDVVIADTAGRLHTKTDLMGELQKISRVCGKALAGAPHETLLVLDATTGQNAIQQANLFKEVVDVTSIALTKLDGTAKGGIILGICDEMRIPVRYIGIGEGVADLREFVAGEFVEALFSTGEATGEATGEK